MTPHDTQSTRIILIQRRCINVIGSLTTKSLGDPTPSAEPRLNPAYASVKLSQLRLPKVGHAAPALEGRQTSVKACMTVSFVERIQARVAIRLRSSTSARPWICESCQAHERFARRDARSVSTTAQDNHSPQRKTPVTRKKKDGPSPAQETRGSSTPDKAKRRAEAERRQTYKYQYFSKLADLRKEVEDQEPAEENLDLSETEIAQDDSADEHTSQEQNGSALHQNRRERPNYQQRVFTISEMLEPDVWPVLQSQVHAPLQRFLLEQIKPQTRFDQLKDESDPYGIILALRFRDTYRMITALEHAANDEAYIQSIPPTTWTQILHAMNPQKFDLSLHKIQRSFNETSLKQADYDWKQSCNRWSTTLMHILHLRRETPRIPKPDIVDYQCMLTFAAMVGSSKTARTLWQLMLKDRVEPNRICYNRYLEAIVWDETARLRLRRHAKSNFPYKTTNIALFSRGKAVEVKEMVQEMRRAGIVPDIDTYCVLMIISARDADFEMVKNVLMSGWNINIPALEAGREDVPLLDKHPPGSILHPTPRLLVTIAEAYGLANRMPAGFRVVDYIAREYGLKLESHIWYTLLRWTWLQARVKQKHRTVEEIDPQQLTELTVRTLIETMTSEPYNIELDLDLYHLSFKNWIASPFAFVDNFDPSLAIEIMESLREDYIDLCKVGWQSDKLIATKRKYSPTWSPAIGSEAISLTVPHADGLRSEKYLHRQTLVKWTLQMLQVPRSKHYGIDRSNGPRNESLTDWRVRGVPRFLALFATFVGNKVEYQIDTGVVNLVFRNDAEVEIAKAQTTAGKPERFHTQSVGKNIRNRRLWGARRTALWKSRLDREEPELPGLWEAPDAAQRSDERPLVRPEAQHWRATTEADAR